MKLKIAFILNKKNVYVDYIFLDYPITIPKTFFAAFILAKLQMLILLFIASFMILIISVSYIAVKFVFSIHLFIHDVLISFSNLVMEHWMEAMLNYFHCFMCK